ncbi:hypothetical protein C7B65_06445 [Phormidesmis priestleyi ULC007]|uniref:Transposase IS110-like N-terminal domain-containing protein n=1 Tax=Phormidesmis priestleyi ULC007 TaxID=1920490 RepID=A0A2T1DJ62_9CYAN|nr:transposase [Phormidesmis priestleyi]PSB20540.1 hypothetical protein C7B65_06445 [Phormidesmis priestleyi ULC007]PZO54210.1 MAG: hypothetical protein DCF14_02090 [Phormidesmis priestleyi]
MGTNITVAGIDISRSSISVCILSEIPPDLKRFKQGFKKLEFAADREGITQLLALPFDGALMEPTGAHYSKIWAHHLIQAGREVRWVGHREIANYRESWKVFNKSDRLDAIALACYGLERWNRPQFFIRGVSSRLRDLVHQLESLTRIRNPIVARLRLQLAHECPEIAQKQINRNWLTQNPPGVLRAMIGNPSAKWEKILSTSIGTGISSFSQGLAHQLILVEEREFLIEQEIAQEMERDEFQPYLQVFDRYAIGDRTSAALLGVIYPISQFLGADGKPIIERIEGSKRYRSLASFKLALGVGMVQYQSGGTQGEKAGGRSDIRRALWRWCTMAIIIDPNLELPTIQKLRHYYENGTDAIVKGELKHLDPGKGDQRSMRVIRRMITMLFHDLITL